jgi:hypothetical protein
MFFDEIGHIGGTGIVKTNKTLANSIGEQEMVTKSA